MARVIAYRLGLAVLALAAFFLLWSFAYEVVVGLRWAPTRFPSEGTTRWALLKVQNADRSSGFALIAWHHFAARFAFPPTGDEAMIRAGLATAGVVALIGGLAVFGYANRRQMPFGAARFGTLLEAARGGLTGRTGIVLGTLGGATIRSDEPAHVLVVGPSRSGKGTGFVIPNGYLWPGSAVFFDPKRENFAALANHRRAMGNQVFLFSPGSNDTHRYNPLDFVRRDERMATDCLVVASFIIPEKGDDTWAGAGRLLLSALIGYVIASPLTREAQHMRTVARLTTSGKDISAVLKTIVRTERAHLPTFVVDNFNQYVALEPETRNSAVFNINLALSTWNNGLIAAATKTSDFDIRELRRKPVTIFIGCTIAELAVFRPLIRILFQQIHDVLMARLPGPDEPHQVLLMLDEFYHVGRMDALISKITISAGYGFRMCLVLQDLAQLDELYGRNTRTTTLSGAQIKLFIQINDLDTSEFVSEMLGDTTQVYKTPVVRPGDGLFAPRGWAPHYTPRRLMSPLELREMSPRRAILILKNSRSFELTKIRHYRDLPYRPLYEATTGRPPALPELRSWSDETLGGIFSQASTKDDGADDGERPVQRARGRRKSAAEPAAARQEAPRKARTSALSKKPVASARLLAPVASRPAGQRRSLTLGDAPTAPPGETCNIRDALTAADEIAAAALDDMLSTVRTNQEDVRVRVAADALRQMQAQFGDDGRAVEAAEPSV